MLWAQYWCCCRTNHEYSPAMPENFSTARCSASSRLSLAFHFSAFFKVILEIRLFKMIWIMFCKHLEVTTSVTFIRLAIVLQIRGYKKIDYSFSLDWTLRRLKLFDSLAFIAALRNFASSLNLLVLLRSLNCSTSAPPPRSSGLTRCFLAKAL